MSNWHSQNGLHFTTPQLSDLADRLRENESAYKRQQNELVKNAVTTAKTYLPILEAACSLVSELDVLGAFATVSALSPETYCRPILTPLGNSESVEGSSRMIILEDARHPCVELMDGMDFIPNSYHLELNKSNFQIITGPNMVGELTYFDLKFSGWKINIYSWYRFDSVSCSNWLLCSFQIGSNFTR